MLESSFKPATLVELLRHRALSRPEKHAYSFLTDGEQKEIRWTYADLDAKARAIAAHLQEERLTGTPALLLYPPGLDYIAAFFGCLYAGVIAVPAYPPDPTRLKRTMPRLKAIAEDAGAATVLTTKTIRTMARLRLGRSRGLGDQKWLVTDRPKKGLEDCWREPVVEPGDVAFLQYTSGSTGKPKGVILTHNNLLRNESMIQEAFATDANTVVAGWLPLYHDMGLIGNMLHPLYLGSPSILMSPIHFLKKPLRWLKAITRYKATASGGPNFGYDLCVRKISPKDREQLDLSSWELAFNGAEPIRHDSLRRFAETFAPQGFRWESFYPCYGLAEATLFVSGGYRGKAPMVEKFDLGALAENSAVITEDGPPLVGSGETRQDLEIAIVDPETGRSRPSDTVGEIWLRGSNIARGYWNRVEDSAYTFEAMLEDGERGPYLRTGDLGFQHRGELFVTGRIKDLIIIRGRNHYPQDIELTVQQCHPDLRPGCVAAFSVEQQGQERLVIVQEVRDARKVDADGVLETIRRAVSREHGVKVYAVVLIKPRTIPKTSSGKIQRHACKAAFLKQELEVVKASVVETGAGGSRRERRDEPVMADLPD